MAQPRSVAADHVVGVLFLRLVGLSRDVHVFLREHAAEEVGHQHIEAVVPDRVRIRLVVVIVPGPVRRHHEIAGLHRDLRAFDDRAGAALRRFEDEAERVSRVTMRVGALARQQQLDAAAERGQCRRRHEAPQCRVHEVDVASLGLFDREHVAQLEQLFAGVGELPRVRYRGAHRRRGKAKGLVAGRVLRVGYGEVGREIVGEQLFDELLTAVVDFFGQHGITSTRTVAPGVWLALLRFDHHRIHQRADLSNFSPQDVALLQKPLVTKGHFVRRSGQDHVARLERQAV